MLISIVTSDEGTSHLAEVTYFKTDRQDKGALGRAVLNQGLALSRWIWLNNSFPKLWPEVKTSITEMKLIGDNNFRIQSWSVFINNSKIFIPQQILKLPWLVCTLKTNFENCQSFAVLYKKGVLKISYLKIL